MHDFKPSGTIFPSKEMIGDKFDRFETWLRDNGARFDQVKNAVLGKDYLEDFGVANSTSSQFPLFNS